MMGRSLFIPDARILLAAADPLAIALGTLGIVVLVMVVVTAMRRRGGPARGSGDAGEAGDTARDRIERIREQATGRGMPARLSDSDGESDAAGVKLAVRLAAQLDGKAERLERLMVEARELCERLEAGTLCARNEADRPSDHPETASVPAAPVSTSGDGRRSLGRRDAAAEEPAARPAVGGLPDDPLFARIFSLADGGLPAVEIARQVDEPTGKVELVLALRDATRRG